MTAENDPFYYAGPRPNRRGYFAISLETLASGPFRFKVEAVPPKYAGFYYSRLIFDIPVETFYYSTWVGFLSDWKRKKRSRYGD